MNILKTLKEIFIPSSIFADITEENLRSQKMRLRMTEYKKWLKNKQSQLEIIKNEEAMKGIKIPESWIEKISLVEREIREIEGF